MNIQSGGGRDAAVKLAGAAALSWALLLALAPPAQRASLRRSFPPSLLAVLPTWLMSASLLSRFPSTSLFRAATQIPIDDGMVSKPKMEEERRRVGDGRGGGGGLSATLLSHAR